MRATSLLLTFALTACAPGGYTPAASVDSQACDSARCSQEARLARDEAETAAITAGTADLVRRYILQARELQSAAAGYVRAIENRRTERGLLRDAQQAFAAARDRWRAAQYAIIVAAMVDATALTRARVERPFAKGCEASMSTKSLRAWAVKAGFDLTGMHVDHIVPRVLGGADHPSNYQIIPAAENMSLGAAWGPAKCELVGRAACEQAVAVSRRCGSFMGGVPY
jgi:hypothetical protein